jgi:hypothetical protein
MSIEIQRQNAIQRKPVTAQLRPNVIHTSKIRPHFPQVPRNRVAPIGRQSSFSVVTAAAKKFASFQEMISESDVVLVDFYATWCGPCTMMSQIMVRSIAFIKILADCSLKVGVGSTVTHIGSTVTHIGSTVTHRCFSLTYFCREKCKEARIT